MPSVAVTVDPLKVPPRTISGTILGQLRRRRVDIVVASLFFAAGLVICFFVARAVDPGLYKPRNDPVYFQAGVGRVFETMTSLASGHDRSGVHPLFSLVAYPSCFVLRRGLHVPEITSARIFVATVAGLIGACFFALMRAMGLRPFDAMLFTLLGGVSAFSVFWYSVPESYALGSLSIVIALFVAAVGVWRRRTHVAIYSAASALTLSFTVTNWMVGLGAMWIRFGWRKTVAWSTVGFVIVAMLWAVQWRLLPEMQNVLQFEVEKAAILSPDSGGPVACVRSFVFHTVIMPRIGDFNFAGDRSKAKQVLTIQDSGIGSATPWGLAGAVLWAGLLAFGVATLFRVKHRTMRYTLLLAVGGQLVLHVLYGEETFRYSAHFGPILLAIAAIGATTRFRRPVLVATILLLLCAAMNNSATFVDVFGDLPLLPPA